MEQDFRTIHEDGVLEGIFDFISTSEIGKIFRNTISRIDQNAAQKKLNGFNVSRNIAKSASALTATFPVIVTEATSVENAVMVSKSIERKAVEMLRMLFAANQITNMTGAQEYLNQFHNNLNNSIDISGMGVDDVIEYMDGLHEPNGLGESAKFPPEMQALINQGIKAVCEDTKNNIHYVLETGLNKTSIQEFKLHGSLNNPMVWKEESVLNELTVHNPSKVERRTTVTNNGEGTTIEITTNNDPGINDIKAGYELLNKSVIPTDIRKANEASPSMVIVNFITTELGSGNNVTTTAVIGVKAVLHYVKSEEMVNRIITKNTDNRTLFNFIRATTREIAFFKDFLFAVDKAKIDALARSGKGSNSKIWKILELRADRSRLNKSSGSNNTNCAAITSIIISKEEVDLIKKHHRIDLMRPGVLTSIMRGYNFMCAAIIDEVSEKVDFLYDDGSSRFETLSFASLEREDSNGTLKKVINIMSKRG